MYCTRGGTISIYCTRGGTISIYCTSEVLYIYTAPEEVLYLYTRGGFLVLQEGLEVHEGPGMPGLVGGSVVLSSSVVVLQNGSYGGPYAGDTPSPLLQLQPPVSQLLVAAARLHHHYISVSSY